MVVVKIPNKTNPTSIFLYMECPFQNAELNFMRVSSFMSLIVENHVVIHISIIAKWRESYQMLGRRVILVAHTGVEPVISALRGRRPGPLDECALFSAS